jgi:phospholipid transport system substrate-binding protein
MPVIDLTGVIRASVVALAVTCGFAATPAHADNGTVPPGEPAIDVVESLHEALLGVMKGGDDLGFDGRYDLLAKVLPNLFDIPFMAEKSVGRHWKTATEAERTQLLSTFNRFMISNYAGNFDSHSGQVFETLGEAESTHGTTIVQTQIVETDGEVIQLNYRLRPSTGRWSIIDVYLNGTVSELALRRSEYSTLIQREGFDALITALNEKIVDLSGATPADSSP